MGKIGFLPQQRQRPLQAPIGGLESGIDEDYIGHGNFRLTAGMLRRQPKMCKGWATIPWSECAPAPRRREAVLNLRLSPGACNWDQVG